jgi:DNA-binding IclR family transcriptional regulator
LSGEELDSYFDGLKPQAFTPQTVTSKPQLRKEIVKVRQVGFALDLEEFVPNLCCVSVPVMNQDGSAPVAAISMAMPRMRFKRTQVPQWCRQLREKASLITQQLAFIG